MGKLPVDSDGRFKVGTVLRKKFDEEVERDENADANPNVGTEDDDRAEKWIEGKVVDVDKDDADNPLPYSVEFDDGTFEDLAHEELEVWVQARIKHQKTEERRAWEEEMERKRSEREAEREAKLADKEQKAAEKAAKESTTGRQMEQDEPEHEEYGANQDENISQQRGRTLYTNDGHANNAHSGHIAPNSWEDLDGGVFPQRNYEYPE